MSYYATPFDFNAVMTFLGLMLYQQGFLYYYPDAAPATEEEYDTLITWNDTNPQPTWDYIHNGDGWTAYDAYYQALSASRTQSEVVAGELHTEIGSAIASVPSQVQSDWNATSGLGQILNKPSLFNGSYSSLSGAPSIPSAQKALEGTSVRSPSFPIFKSSTVASGAAVFQLTSDGTSTGTALFPTGVIIDSVNVSVNDATAAYQMSWAFTNSNKTLTVTANKLTTSNILTGVLGQASANAAIVKLAVWGY